MNDNYYREQYLRHYGVLGMKWGKRKGSAVTTAKGIKKGSKSQNAKPRRMSNKELQSRLKRLRMEQEYKRLSAEANVKPATKSKLEGLVKAAGTIATLTGTALTIYNNVNKAMEIANKVKGA